MKRQILPTLFISLLAVTVAACGYTDDVLPVIDTAYTGGEAAVAGEAITIISDEDDKQNTAPDTAQKNTDNTEHEADSPADVITISNIHDYTIIYPQDATTLEKACAHFLADYIFEQTGAMPVIADDDSYDETLRNGYEILIGGTNREASQEAMKQSFSSRELLIKADGKKIVLYGNGLMTAGAVGQFAHRYINGREDIQFSIDSNTEEYEMAQPRNAVIMIGDGMGFMHIEFAKANGMETFTAELLPNKGALLTGCYPGGAPDSAAAATAMSSGYKTRYTYVGVDKDAVARQNIRELAYERGYKTAVVTTDMLTGATPAAFLAHINSRYKTGEIRAQIDAAKEREGDMLYIAGTNNEPMHSDIATALKHVSTGGEGFLIMIEEEWIDYHAHYYERTKLADSVRRFDEAVAYATAFVMAHPDTILIVASDHETGGLVKNDDGTFSFTSGREHTETPVPIYAWGAGTEIFHSTETENTEVAKFLAAAIFGIDNYGDFTQ